MKHKRALKEYQEPFWQMCNKDNCGRFLPIYLFFAIAKNKNMWYNCQKYA